MGHSPGVLRLIGSAYSFPPACLRHGNLKSGGANSLDLEIPPDETGRELFSGAGEQWSAKLPALEKPLACGRWGISM